MAKAKAETAVADHLRRVSLWSIFVQRGARGNTAVIAERYGLPHGAEESNGGRLNDDKAS